MTRQRVVRNPAKQVSISTKAELESESSKTNPGSDQTSERIPREAELDPNSTETILAVVSRAARLAKATLLVQNNDQRKRNNEKSTLSHQHHPTGNQRNTTHPPVTSPTLLTRGGDGRLDLL